MSPHSTSNLAALRIIAVIVLSILVVCCFAADIRRLWLPLGVNGFGTNADGVVTGIDASSPAANARIQLGDRVDVRLTPREFSFLFFSKLLSQQRVITSHLI